MEEQLRRVLVSVSRTLESIQWSTGYDQCPACSQANPNKMESYRAGFSGKPEDFHEEEFGHSELCRVDKALHTSAEICTRLAAGEKGEGDGQAK